ncbi:hypothetical protein SAMN04487904_101528 [Actinopolyspora lacussalsi subsp. righensis]|uniref:Uncharacterized protein n=1 Tax=Actinopolyspora righensis TaxID=995060 RepID=A0A1I6XF89_9ACTN|nr:hypothetical protein SAMN04487904_101528 [Actinopolyspora righensis]
MAGMCTLSCLVTSSWLLLAEDPSTYTWLRYDLLSQDHTG